MNALTQTSEQFSLNRIYFKKKQHQATFCLLSPSGTSEHDLYLSFCGTWRHDSGALSLIVNLSTGCSEISISAGQSSLSIDGQITAGCSRSEVIPLKQLGLKSQEETRFCLYWEPLLDQLKLQVKRVPMQWKTKKHVSLFPKGRFISCLLSLYRWERRT